MSSTQTGNTMQMEGGGGKYVFSMLFYAYLLWKTMYETYTLPLKGAKLPLLDNPYGKHFEIVFQGILPLPHCFCNLRLAAVSLTLCQQLLAGLMDFLSI